LASELESSGYSGNRYDELQIADFKSRIANARFHPRASSDLRLMPRPRTRVRQSAIRNPRSAIAAPQWAAIRLFAMDVDGVLTDGTVHISSDGTEAKSFSILDGMGLRRLDLAGIITAWISGRPSAATTLRAKELKIPHLVQGRIDKLAALQELATTLGIPAAQCAYMGDDSIDAPAMEWAAVGIAPHEAMPAALAAADYITTRPAGRGAVREVCEQLLASRSRFTIEERSRGKSGRSKRS
jgi:3-deoxy-D-manno-octulosonate 8-phosphate phosphatase (KDO 8-P phosphatase)